MASIDSGNSPGTRITAGDDVLRAAEQVTTAAVAKKLTAFRKRHGAYCAADKRVKQALARQTKQERLLGQKDAAQDGDVDVLATKLAGDGLPRTNPFKPFGAPAPSALKVTDAKDEAVILVDLSAKVQKRAGLSDASRAAAKKATGSARAVLAAAKPIPALAKKVRDAMAARETLAPGWEKAFAVLKRAARTAEDDGAPGLYEALFVRSAPKAPAKKKAAKQPAPAKPAQPANGGATP